MLEKNLLRQKYLNLRKKLPPKAVAQKSKKIAEQLLVNFGFADKNYILAYLPVNNEVATRYIIDNLIKKRRIFVPCLHSDDKTYHFCEFDKFNDLEPGPYKILQPKNHRIVDARQIEAAIIPGLAFDRKGVRLGYGKGVYDKLLFDSSAVKIGLAFDFQIVDKLPIEKHDLVMDIILTEKRKIVL